MISNKIQTTKNNTNNRDLPECSQPANEILENEDKLKKLFGLNKKSVLMWSESEFKNCQRRAHVMTKDEKNLLLKEKKDMVTKLTNESNERKKLLQDASLKQISIVGSKLHGEESEAADRNRYVLQRAFDLLQEQEDEVKQANSIILGAKCLSIRKAQLLEKKLIEKELKERDLKIEELMEEERRKILKIDQEQRQKRQEFNMKYINTVLQQIRDNEMQKELHFMRKQEEINNVRKSLKVMQEEELKKVKEKRMQQERTKNEINEANEAMVQLKIKREQEEPEREAAREAELEQLKHEKNLQIASIQEQQKRVIDQKAIKEEMKMLQIYEGVERAWRDKEKAYALKRKTDIENLKKEREKQVTALQNAQAIEMERDKEELQRATKVQQELYEMELEKKRRQKEAAKNHCKDLIEQINMKEIDRMQQQKLIFEERQNQIFEKEVRELNIENTLRKKLKILRENNIPESVVKDIQRQLNLK
ncbi:hypothetical protein FQR65_LT03937 [Abscondita terminalis]|nr:hypothetical protein FQR65_LT03937 [Abscondita terminalis]